MMGASLGVVNPAAEHCVADVHQAVVPATIIAVAEPRDSALALLSRFPPALVWGLTPSGAAMRIQGINL